MTNTNIATGDLEIDVKLQILYDAIDSKNKEDTLKSLNDLLEESLSNSNLASWITTPVNITDLHEKLVESLDVHPRAMQLRNRIPHRQRRGVFFIKAMINGVNKT